MTEYSKIKVTFSDGSKRVLKHPAELEKANKNRMIRLVFSNGKYTDLHLGRVCTRLGIVKVRDYGLIQEGIELSKIMGWCYTYPFKNKRCKKSC